MYDVKWESSGPVRAYLCTRLVGGAAGALDALTGMSGGEKALVFDVNYGLLVYEMDSANGGTERLPGIVVPDTRLGNEAWVLLAWIKCNAPTGHRFST